MSSLTRGDFRASGVEIEAPSRSSPTVAEVAGVQRLLSEAAFARYIGLAPTTHSSGETTLRMRSARHGSRQLNMALRRIAATQIHHEGLGNVFFQRRTGRRR